MSSSTTDTSFQLYDLRVEVVCPTGKRIMCGAKEGDYFTLKGEMMYLPQDQGISIYSLCAFSLQALFLHILTKAHRWTTVLTSTHSIRIASPRSETTRDAQERLDDDRCADRLSGSLLSVSAENCEGGDSDLQAWRYHFGPLG